MAASNIMNVQALATAYADHQLANREVGAEERAEMQHRLEWNFKVTGFNAATVATVVSIALLVFVHSPLVFILSALSYAIRNSFKYSILEIATEEDRGDGELFYKFIPLKGDRFKALLARHLGLMNEQWEGPVHRQILEFVVWLNRVPLEQQVERPRVREEYVLGFDD